MHELIKSERYTTITVYGRKLSPATLSLRRFNLICELNFAEKISNRIFHARCNLHWVDRSVQKRQYPSALDRVMAGSNKIMILILLLPLSVRRAIPFFPPGRRTTNEH